MTFRIVSALALVGSLLLPASAAARRAVIFRDPGFARAAPLKGAAAFVIRDRIDIHSMVEDFVDAFDGNYAAGEAYTRGVIADCLAGRRVLQSQTSALTSGKPLVLKLADLNAVVPDSELARDLTASTDSLGVTSLTVSRPDSMKAALAAVRADYLIVIHSLRAWNGQRGGAPMMTPGPFGTGWMSTGGVPQPYITLSGQVLVFRADTMAPIWNGFVTGRHDIGRFRKTSAERLAVAFATDLTDALK